MMQHPTLALGPGFLLATLKRLRGGSTNVPALSLSLSAELDKETMMRVLVRQGIRN
jgi:hypothetical protein